MTLDEDAAIAARWPGKWAHANDPKLRSRSKARNNLRKAYRAAVELDAFVAANPNANCGNCDNRLVNPTPGLTGLFCALGSDFHGYQRTDATRVCAKYRGAAA
jgi:hypothetical protein